jgi:cyclophilin family peptidyl-prolyl cis-trans isomerase
MRRFFMLLAVLATGMGTARAGTVVEVSTGLGSVFVELYDADKPVTVNNFLTYVRSNAYQNCFFHRCVPNFVLQGGGYGAIQGQSTNLIAPPWANLFEIPNYGAITNEYSVGRRFSNLPWTVAMAKLGGDPNSASSEWFFNLANNAANLDNQNGGFTVFGHVVSGTNILGLFNQIGYGANLVNLQSIFPSESVASLFTALPNYTIGTNPPPYNKLVYFNTYKFADPIQVTASLAGVVSWNSTLGFTNVIEVSTNLPLVWAPKYRVPGTGAAMTYTDPDARVGRRFYRVRVEYY